VKKKEKEKTKLKDHAYCHYKEGRKKEKSFKKVQTPRFWVLTLLTERGDAPIMHAQVDDKKAARSPSM